MDEGRTSDAGTSPNLFKNTPAPLRPSMDNAKTCQRVLPVVLVYRKRGSVSAPTLTNFFVCCALIHFRRPAHLGILNGLDHSCLDLEMDPAQGLRLGSPELCLARFQPGLNSGPCLCSPTSPLSQVLSSQLIFR